LSEREIIEFDGELVTFNVMLDEKAVKELRNTWLNRVKGVQPPLIETFKHGLHVTIPWVLKDE